MFSFPMTMMGGGSTLWDPTQITTDLWLDAADSATITESSGAVSQWDDKSGNDRHATQGTGSLQPIYNAVDSRIEFNGSRFFTVLPGWGNYWEWFLVFKHDRTDVLQVSMRDTATANSTAIHGYSSSSVNFYRVRNTSSSFSTNIATEFGTDIVIQNLSSNTDDTATARTDGTDVTTWSVSGSMGSTLYIGVNGAFGGNGLQGNIYEFVLTPSPLSLIDRQKLEGYLAHKWGLTAKLPGGHPYKTTAPTV